VALDFDACCRKLASTLTLSTWLQLMMQRIRYWRLNHTSFTLQRHRCHSKCPSTPS